MGLIKNALIIHRCVYNATYSNNDGSQRTDFDLEQFMQLMAVAERPQIFQIFTSVLLYG